MSLRLVAGAAGGRRLAVPPGARTRPTADRTREALFSSLEALLGGLAGLSVLDLYAGSGALGLEALSRGASTAVLVEADGRVQRVLRENVRAAALPGARVAPLRAERFAAEAPPREAPFDLVLADPPYAVTDAAVARLLADLVAGGHVADGALLVVERPARGAAPAWPDGVEPVRDRRYGVAHLWLAQRGPAPAAERAAAGDSAP